ncbi:MAG: restriction endonuclease subunit S [Candidatus Hydrogenedentes bacterium]|nr:restriction endonuclease subunit S [Candidatus Hydrogenedentota bacterium]
MNSTAMPLKTLASITTITMGQSPPGESYNTDTNGLPFFQGKAEFGDKYPQIIKWCTAPTRIAEEGDILMSVRAPVGPVNIAPCKCCIGRGLASIRPDKTKVDRGYLWHFFGYLQPQLSNKGEGSTFAAINRNDVEQIKIPLPPLPEQKRIAALLDKADAIRRKRAEARQLTDAFLQSVFINTVGPLAPNYNNWSSYRIEQLADPVPGAMRTGPFGSDLKHSEFVDEGIAVLGIDNAVQNRFTWAEKRFITEEKYADLMRYTVKPQDVIITIMGTTGRSAVVPNDIPLAISTKHLATITVNRDLVYPEFLSFCIHLHPDILKQIDVANKGAIMSGLNLGVIKGLRIKLPPINVQKAFVSKLRKVEHNREMIKASSEKSNTLFKCLVQYAFKGKL